jgi:hypothetical protein
MGITGDNLSCYLSSNPVIAVQIEVIRIRKSKKNRKHNGQKKKYKGTNNDLQTAKRAALTRKSHDTADKLLDWYKAIPHSLTHT